MSGWLHLVKRLLCQSIHSVHFLLSSRVAPCRTRLQECYRISSFSSVDVPTLTALPCRDVSDTGLTGLIPEAWCNAPFAQLLSTV